MAEIKKIYSNAVTAVQSTLGLLRKQATLGNVLDLVQIQQPIDFGLLSKFPGIATLRLSVLNVLRNGELPTLADLYYAYR